MLDKKLLERARAARQEERSFPLASHVRVQVNIELAAHFVEHSEGLEGHHTTARDVKKSADTFR